MLLLIVNAGRRTRERWHEQSHAQDEKINFIIEMHLRDSAQRRAEHEAFIAQQQATNHEVDKKLLDLSEELKRVEQSWQDLRDRLCKGRNGESIN